jgi:alkylhydroperoxidase/carboxymuconolactone decarboxylase family protein YurZ
MFVLVFSIEAIAETRTVNTQALSPKQQSIVTISAFTANGDLEKLKTALNQGLDTGLTVNEIKGILVQLYAYTGFPRSLNGISTFMGVMDERQKKGISDVAKVKQIEAAKPTVLVINFINPWVINEVEPGAAAVLATFDVKAEALLDVVRGRFSPAGKLPLTIPADQAAVDKNAPDVPGYAEAFDYAYKNRANDKYLYGFGLTYRK